MQHADVEAVLGTARLLLEPQVPAHAAALYAPLCNPALYRFIPQDPPTSVQALEAQYERLATRRSPDGTEYWLNWALRLRATGAYAGVFQATIFPDRTAALAYMIFTSAGGQGYATEAGLRILAELYGPYQVLRVAAEIDTRNSASIRLVERLGFARVATTRNADYFKGAASDEYRYERSAD
jgi:RimJ/RimL family protein N-acetyltransferase